MSGLSIVMATYNGERYLEEQLASLAAQEVAPDELIVADDRSEDSTVPIVESFARTAPFPVVIRRNEQRLGYGENFLRASRAASGDVLAFCDQDDVWSPSKVGTALEVLRTTRADLFVHTAAVIDDEGRLVDSFDQGITEDAVHPPLHLGPWSVFYGFSMVFPRRLLDLIDPARRGAHTFEHSGLLSHDLWIYFLATSVGRVVTDTRPLVRYRRHGRNVTPSMRARWTTALGVAAHPDLRRDEIAAHRAQLMGDLRASAADPVVRSHAADAARYWNQISEYERARIDFYTAERPVRRAGGLVKLASSGGYRSFSAGGLGARLLVKDALVGVARARRRPT